MSEQSDADTDEVSVSMELSGPYADVMSKLTVEETTGPSLSPLAEDLTALLETVERIDGGTRSAIAEALPAETTVDYDPEAVVETMQVLERYDLVVLEGNTWKPGPAFRS